MKNMLKHLILFSCILFSFCKEEKKVERLNLNWKKSENQLTTGISEFSEKTTSDKIKLTDSIQINKYSIDSLIDNTNFTTDGQNYIVSSFGFNCEKINASLEFDSKKITVYKITWINETANVREYSNTFLYAKDYGIIYKSYNQGYKTYITYRLVNYKIGENALVNLDDFTKSILEKYKMSNWEELKQEKAVPDSKHFTSPVFH